MADQEMRTVSLEISFADFKDCRRLDDWHAVIRRWADMIPKKYRESAVIACERDFETLGYDIVSAYYERPATPEEIEAEAKARDPWLQAEERNRQIDAEERTLYEQLKAKFEPKE